MFLSHFLSFESLLPGVCAAKKQKTNSKRREEEILHPHVVFGRSLLPGTVTNYFHMCEDAKRRQRSSPSRDAPDLGVHLAPRLGRGQAFPIALLRVRWSSSASRSREPRRPLTHRYIDTLGVVYFGSNTVAAPHPVIRDHGLQSSIRGLG